MGNTVTPSRIGPELRGLLGRLGVPSDPVRLAVRPLDHCRPLECFANATRCVALHGGSVQHGWRLWEWPTVLVEAEFHAVWRRPDGALQDVTPAPDGECEILFVADPERVYSGVRVDNVRVAVCAGAVVRDYIRVSEIMAEMVAAAPPAPVPGAVAVPREYADLLDFKALLEHMLEHALTEHQPCGCGSGIKYRKCHGELWRRFAGSGE